MSEPNPKSDPEPEPEPGLGPEPEPDPKASKGGLLLRTRVRLSKVAFSRMFLHFWERVTSTVRTAYGRLPHDVSSWNGALPNPEGPADAQRGGKGAFNRGYLSQMIFNRRESCSQLLIGSVPFDRRIGDPFTIFSEGAVPGRSREILRGEPAKVCQGVAGFERRLLSREMC